MKEKLLLTVGKHSLIQTNCHILPYCWFEKHDQALGRDDGLIYIAGFRTREKADAYAKKSNIIN